MTSRIEWTDTTWNPVVGCSRMSEGCRNCYAERLAGRLARIGKTAHKYGSVSRPTPKGPRWTGRIYHDATELTRPDRWRKPRRVFVCSMADLFHKDVRADFIADVLHTIERNRAHTFQVLTKRPERMRELINAWRGHRGPIANLWLGVSVESADTMPRIEALRETIAAVRFLSCEPLLGPLDGLDLERIHWVITGDESGPGRRPALIEWVRGIRDTCVNAAVPFFFKQWHLDGKKQGLPELDGQQWAQFPGERS